MSSSCSPIEDELADALEAGTGLDLTGRPDDQRAITADYIRMLLRGRRCDPDTRKWIKLEPDPRGLQLCGALIKDRIDLDSIDTETGLTLSDCTIPHGLTARNARIPHLDLTYTTLGQPEPNIRAAVDLSDAHLGSLDLTDATVTNETGPALGAQHLHVDRNAWLGGQFTGSGQDGAVRLHSGRIGGQLILDGATITNQTGPALQADRLQTDSSTRLSGQFTGNGEDGAVRLPGGRIGGQLLLDGATITNQTGPAFDADNLYVSNNTLFRGHFAGNGQSGSVRLHSARIGGQLILDSATITNQTGPALTADGLHVDNSARLGGQFTGTGELGTVRLLGARLGSQLDLAGATITNHMGSVLDTTAAVVDSDFFLGEQTGQIRLTDTTVRGNLHISPVKDRELAVDGLTYRNLHGTSWQQWLDVLRSQTPGYTPQPYRQLAAITTAAGHDSDTRRILIAQRKDQLARAGLSRRARAWGRFTGIALGYGYQPWRALIGLLAITFAAAVLFWLPALGGEGLHTKDTSDPCPTTDRITLGIDTALPLITTPVASSCLTNPNPQGQAIGAIGIATQLVGWATATLFIAGFTSAVRKT